MSQMGEGKDQQVLKGLPCNLTFVFIRKDASKEQLQNVH